MKTLFKIISAYIGVSLFYIETIFASTRSVGNPKIAGNITKGLNGPGSNFSLGALLEWSKNQLMVIAFIFAVCAFIFIGIKMATARGNPEEFKKSWMWFIYAVLGLFFVFAGYGIVVLTYKLADTFN